MGRKRHPSLPNGYGSIRYLGKGRRNCYAVHPPTERTDEEGRYIRPKALCYVDDWYVGLAVLNAYHAGTYRPGDELTMRQARDGADTRTLDALSRRILSDFSAQSAVPCGGETFEEVYRRFYDWKYGAGSKKKLSRQSAVSTDAAFKNCATLHKRVFRDLRHGDLQGCVDACPLGSSSVGNMVGLIRQMYKYAILYELCEKDYSTALSAPPPDDEHGVPFTDADLEALWRESADQVAEMVLIMCYSGFRISAYKTMETNLDERYFRGGVKTAASKGRVVPIHSAILPLVERRLARDGSLLVCDMNVFRSRMRKLMKRMGFPDHTPHDCRHTFSRLCEKYGVNENDRKRMLGHSFGSDMTNGVYGHRTVEELRSEIEKIRLN